MHYFLAEVPATADALKKGTKAPDPALRDAMKNVLRPYQYAAEAQAEEDLIELDEPETEAPAKPGDKAGDKKPETKADKKPESKPEKKPDAKPKPPVVAERAMFHDPDKYRAEVEKELPGIIEGKYKSHVTDAGPRAGMPEIEAMAVPAKKETDAVFGQFYDASKRPELKGDRPGKPGKLHFWYDFADTELKAMDGSQKRELARSWLLYYFQSDSDDPADQRQVLGLPVVRPVRRPHQRRGQDPRGHRQEDDRRERRQGRRSASSSRHGATGAAWPAAARSSSTCSTTPTRRRTARRAGRCSRPSSTSTCTRSCTTTTRSTRRASAAPP